MEGRKEGRKVKERERCLVKSALYSVSWVTMQMLKAADYFTVEKKKLKKPEL